MSNIRLSSWYDFRDNNENRPGYIIEHRVLFKYHSPPTPRYGECPKTLEELLNSDIPEKVKLVCIKDCILLSQEEKLEILKEYTEKFLYHYKQLLNTCKLDISKK